MTDTASPKTKIALRDKPRRNRADLTAVELHALAIHVARHPHRSTSWLSTLTWCSEELITEMRST